MLLQEMQHPVSEAVLAMLELFLIQSYPLKYLRVLFILCIYLFMFLILQVIETVCRHHGIRMFVLIWGILLSSGLCLHYNIVMPTKKAMNKIIILYN